MVSNSYDAGADCDKGKLKMNNDLLKEKNKYRKANCESNSCRVFSYVPFNINGITLIEGDCQTEMIA